MWSRTGVSRFVSALRSLREGLEEQAADDLDVGGQEPGDEGTAGVGDGDRDAALVVRGR